MKRLLPAVALIACCGAVRDEPVPANLEPSGRKSEVGDDSSNYVWRMPDVIADDMVLPSTRSANDPGAALENTGHLDCEWHSPQDGDRAEEGDGLLTAWAKKALGDVDVRQDWPVVLNPALFFVLRGVR